MKATINFPQPVHFEYDDSMFYHMIDAFDYTTFNETDVNQLIEAAPSYIRITSLDYGSEIVPLLYEDIVLMCQREIMRKLINKYL